MAARAYQWVSVLEDDPLTAESDSGRLGMPGLSKLQGGLMNRIRGFGNLGVPIDKQGLVVLTAPRTPEMGSFFLEW